MVRVIQALAPPGRLHVVARIAAEPMTARTLAAALDLSVPAVVAHLSHLQSAGLLRAGRPSHTQVYSLAGHCKTRESLGRITIVVAASDGELNITVDRHAPGPRHTPQ